MKSEKKEGVKLWGQKTTNSSIDKVNARLAV